MSDRREGEEDRVGELLQAARRAAEQSYNPYSSYLVGAAVLTRGGRVFSGCFMENASFGMTICAEPAAILAANTAGHRDLSTIAVVGGDPKRPDQGGPCTPCGRCRQIIWEIATINKTNVDVIGADLTLTRVLRTDIRELFPHPWPPMD